MSQIFVCKSCDVTCYYSTTGDRIESDDIGCPRRVLNHRPVWRELSEVD